MKKLASLAGAGALLLLSVATVLAAKPNGPAAYNGLNKGNSDVKHLELYEKDQTTWQAVEGGAWGKVNYDSEKFVFNGHMLEPGTDYALVRYLDPWPGNVVCLGSGVANDGGDVHIAGEWKDGGPKVWLVLSADVNCGGHQMTAWHGEEYLFEYDLIDGKIYVAFESGGTHYDSWWTTTADGVHHEWRSDGYFQFHPSDFNSCDPGFTASFNWTFNYGAYTDLGGDVGDLTDFLVPGNVYHVCRYPGL